MIWQDIDIGETVKATLAAKAKMDSGETLTPDEQISAGIGHGVAALLDKAAPALPHFEAALQMLRQAKTVP